MTKQAKKVTTKSHEHTQVTGVAMFDQWSNEISQGDSFYFSPEDPKPDSVRRFRTRGTGHQMSDGTFEFVASKDYHAHSRLIKKLAHGRLSETRDGFIQFTLRFRIEDGEDVATELIKEAKIAAMAANNA